MRSLFQLGLGIGLAAFMGACSSPPKAKTPEQQKYLSRAEANPLQFSVPLSELDAAIDRAVDWLAEYHQFQFTKADRKVFKEQIRATEAGLLMSPLRYRVGDLGSHGYSVSFVVSGGSVNVAVMHKHEGGFGLGDAVARNAHLLALYIKTGELMPEMIGT